jgi:hypothetical protein
MNGDEHGASTRKDMFVVDAEPESAAAAKTTPYWPFTAESDVAIVTSREPLPGAAKSKSAGVTVTPAGAAACTVTREAKEPLIVDRTVAVVDALRPRMMEIGVADSVKPF